MKEEDEFMFHNDCITYFNNQLYSDIFTDENLVSKKKCITINGEKFYGFFMEKGIKQYFALDEHVEQLPFKVTETIEKDYKNDVFNFIIGITSIKIPAEKKMSFRELVDIMPQFSHTKPLHFLLYKIIALAAFIDRVNYRVSTDAGFGKDSVMNIIGHLVDSMANLYGATMAKLEYVLRNKLIILNELGNLKKDEKIQMQEFLLATGAYFNTYTKRSRKTNTTQEQYDISKLSLVLFYNLPSYYTGKAQEYFDQMFTKAVTNRFIPFVFEGRLTTRFDKVIDVERIVNLKADTYKDVIATINYFRENPLTSIKYEVDRNIIKFPKSLMRYDRSFNVLLKYIAEYSLNQEEFDRLSKELYGCYKKYDKLLEEDFPIQ